MTQNNDPSNLISIFDKAILKGTLVLSIYALISIIAFIIQGIVQGTFERDFCLTDQCLKELYQSHSVLFRMMEMCGKLILSLATILTLYLAIKSYELNQKNNQFNNHIQNLSFFIKIVHEDVEGRRELSKKDININRLYSLIFPSSQKGIFDNFKDYESHLTTLRKYIIEHSNGHTRQGVRRAGAKTNKFIEHRNEIQKLLLKFGIAIQPLQRGNFYQVERSLFEFIDHVTLTFTNLSPAKYLLGDVDIHYRV